jgi:hypothetical protein
MFSYRQAIAAIAFAAATVTSAASAQADSGGHRLLCDHARHVACLTGRAHRNAGVHAGHGTPVRIQVRGRVSPSGPFRAANELGTALAGHKVVQLHVTVRLCVADTRTGQVLVRRCSRATRWVRYGSYLVGVRATNAAGLPCYLAATRVRSRALWALTLNGYDIARQQWSWRPR